MVGAVAAATVTALAVGVPTDVIDTGFFTRMTPVRWWDYLVLVLVTALTGLWVAIPPAGRSAGRPTGVLGAATGAVFAVGCPICNKIIVALLGVSGALALWAPVQPFLAALSVVALGAAVYLRWRRRACTDATCETDGPIEEVGRTTNAVHPMGTPAQRTASPCSTTRSPDMTP